MKKRAVFMAVVVVFGVASAAVSTHLSLDCITGMRTNVVQDMDLSCGEYWCADGGRGVITDNGISLNIGRNGVSRWTPSTGVHRLQLTVTDDAGMRIGVETAKFRIQALSADGNWLYIIADGGAVIDRRIKGGNEIKVPETLGGCPVVELGDNAFSSCSELTTIEIPSGVTRISASAFSGCGNVRSVTVPAGVNVSSVFADSLSKIGSATITGPGTVSSSAYADCVALTSVTVRTGVTDIAAGAFSRCREVSTVSIPTVVNLSDVFPDSVRNIRSLTLTGDLECFDDGHLFRCDSLITLVLPDSTKRIKPGAFSPCPLLEEIVYPTALEDFGLDLIPSEMRTKMRYDAEGFLIVNGWLLHYRDRTASCVCVPDGVVGIGRGALANMHHLKKVVLPDGIRHIGSSAFRGSYIVNLELPDSVVDISADAFRECAFLSSLKIGDGVWSIGDRAFYFCKELESFSGGSALKKIGRDAFSGCMRIRSVILPAGIQSVAPRAFAGCAMPNSVNITTPTDVAKLSDLFPQAFAGISAVNVPSGVTSVRDDMFSGCSELRTVELPDGIVTIGARAFENCAKLVSLTIPRSVRSIGDNAFDGCSDFCVVRVSFGDTERVRALYAWPRRVTFFDDKDVLEGAEPIVDWSY